MAILAASRASAPENAMARKRRPEARFLRPHAPNHMLLPDRAVGCAIDHLLPGGSNEPAQHLCHHDLAPDYRRFAACPPCDRTGQGGSSAIIRRSARHARDDEHGAADECDDGALQSHDGESPAAASGPGSATGEEGLISLDKPMQQHDGLRSSDPYAGTGTFYGARSFKTGERSIECLAGETQLACDILKLTSQVHRVSIATCMEIEVEHHPLLCRADFHDFEALP